jgi:hypothetical protein
MYHLHDIIGFISTLLSITKEHLLVTSEVLPSMIENTEGSIHLCDDGAICAPYLSDITLRIIKEHFKSKNINAQGITTEADFFNSTNLSPNFGPWWWLYTAEFMRRLVSRYPVEILEEGFSKNGRVYQILVKKQ